jgi:hypothetical protein
MGHEDREVAPEIVGYRQYQRMIWQTIRAQYSDVVACGKLGGLDDDAARKAAVRAVRGDIRAFMSEMLTRAPIPALVGFLEVGRDWGDAGERLLEQSDAVLQLIDQAYPQTTWTTLGGVDRQTADDDARWPAWTHTWVEAFAATGTAAQQALSGEPAQRHELATEEDLSSLRRWAPWLVSAAAILGATTVVVAVTRE